MEKLGLNYKLLDEDKFADVRCTLDNMMKFRCQQDLSNTVHKAQVLYYHDENVVWESGFLSVTEYFSVHYWDTLCSMCSNRQQESSENWI